MSFIIHSLFQNITNFDSVSFLGSTVAFSSPPFDFSLFNMILYIQCLDSSFFWEHGFVDTICVKLKVLIFHSRLVFSLRSKFSLYWNRMSDYQEIWSTMTRFTKSNIFFYFFATNFERPILSSAPTELCYELYQLHMLHIFLFMVLILSSRLVLSFPYLHQMLITFFLLLNSMSVLPFPIISNSEVLSGRIKFTFI